MRPADAVLVFLLFLLPSTSPLSCIVPCEPGQESTEQRPCHLCPQLDANDCQSNEIVEGVCGCQECAKAVGGVEYRLARLADKAVPSECLSSCIYTRESG